MLDNPTTTADTHPRRVMPKNRPIGPKSPQFRPHKKARTRRAHTPPVTAAIAIAALSLFVLAAALLAAIIKEQNR